MSSRTNQGTRIVGLLLIAGTVGATLFVGGNWLLFVDLPALLFVLGTTLGLLLWTYGAVGLGLLATLARTLVGAPVHPNPTNATIARAGARYALAAGSLGALIDLLQMLTHMSDPSAILGPGVFNAFLTLFYAILIAEFILYPLALRLGEHPS